MKINLGTGRVVLTDTGTGEYYSFNIKDVAITYFPDDECWRRKGMRIKDIIIELMKYNQNAIIRDFNDPDFIISNIIYDSNEDEIYVEFDEDRGGRVSV